MSNELAKKYEEKKKKVDKALEEYEKRTEKNRESSLTDLTTRINKEIETAKTVSTPSWGKDSLKTTLDSTRESRVNIGNLMKEVEAHRSYLGDEKTNQTLEILKQLKSGYDTHLQVAEGRSQFKDENDYNKWYEGYKESERIKNLDVDSATKELEALKQERSRYTNSSNTAATHLKSLERTNAVQRFRYEQGLTDEEWLSANDPGGVLGLTVKDRPRNVAEATALHQRKVEALTAIAQGKTDEAKVRDYDDRINALERDITNAQRIQNGIALHNDAVNAEDFEKYVQEGIGLGDDIKFSFGGAGYKNDVVGVRNEAYTMPDGTKILAPSSVYNNSLEQKKQLYLNMTEEEVNIYSYYLAKHGKKKAEEYLDSITETVNNRIANKNFEKLEGNTALELFFGVAAGLDQFASGIDKLFSNNDYIPQSHTQMTSGMVREDLEDDGFKLPELMGGGSIAQAGYDAITTTANMMPSILTSLAIDAVAPGVGGVVGSTLMGGSAAGNAYAEMLNLGYSKEQARGYSLLVGGSEALLQTVIGGVGSLGASAAGKAIGGKVGGALTSGLTETILKNVDNAFARFAIKYGTSMIAEGGEEYLQEILTPVFKNLMFNEHNEVKLVTSEAIYSGILGALSAGMLEGVGIAGGEYNVYKTGKALQSVDGAVNRLAEIGKTFSADSVAYRLAGKVDGNTGAYTIGRLFMEEGAVLSEQNLTTITDALIEGGIDEKSAKTLAKTFARVVEGATLTDSQKAVLENCDPLTSAIRESIIGENTTVYQRTQSYKQVQNDALMALAKKKTGAKQGKTTEAAPAEGEATKETAPTEEKKVFKSSTPKQALGVRDEYTYNEDGKTTLKSSGEEVSIKEIASIKDGDVVLTLESGETVNAREVNFSSADTAVIYEAVANMGVNAVVGQAIVDNFDPSHTSAVTYALGVKEAYNYGYRGFKADAMSNKLFASSLTEAQRDLAHKLGQSDATARAKEEQAVIDDMVAEQREIEKETGKKAPKKKGRVLFEGDRKALDKVQRKSLAALDKISEVLGYTFHIFESYEDENGDRVMKTAEGKVVSAPNGWYDPTTGALYIDLYAGQNGHNTILFTAAHELTHAIKQWSPAKYETFKNFLLEEYGKRGISVEQLVANQIAKAKENGRDIDYDEALEEVVADSCEAFLADSNAIEKIARLKAKDKSLWNRIKTEIESLVKKIRQLYQGIDPDSEEGKYVRQMKDTLEELHALWTDALVDAGESYSLLATMAESTDPVAVEEVTQYSYRSLAKAAGFEAVINEDGTRSFMRDGKKVSKVTIEDIENSAIGAFINYSLEKGDIDDVQAKRQKQMFADVCTTACKTNDFSMTMQFMGSAVFTGMKANADKQYGTTYDFPSICTKTQAIIDAMSARMVHLGRGLSSDEIVKLYQKVFASGNPVPCPECYVFSRWIGIGGLLDNIKKYQDYYGNMSVTEVADAYREMRAKVESFAEEQKMSFGKAKGALTSKLTKEYNKLTEKIEKNENQGEAVKDADRKRLAELEPMMNTVKAMTWLEGVYFADSTLTKVNPKFRVPNEVLFDLNRGEDFATEYKEAWAFRTTQGAGYGKAITPYAEASLGEGVLVTNNTTNAIKGKAKGTLDNYFLKQKGTMDADARKALDKARLKQKIQAFIGGQRFQSTSDARYENASDYLLAALEMQAMKGMVQVYTKVDGAVPAFSAWGFSINQSLMPLNGGLDKNGNVIDTPVGGMNRDIAVNNRKKHESAGTITIGVNDNHIRAMFSQVIRDFIIPYHASGGKADVVAAFRQIQEGKLAKGKAMVRSTDYSRTQSDKVLSDEVLRWQGKTEAEIEQIHKVREARIAILTGGKVDMDVVRGNRFLTALYDKLHDGEWKGVKLAKSKVESQIYPNEFWDQSVTYEESGKITRDYLEYCDDLGFLHRFSGLVPSNGMLVSVKGYDENGNRVELTDLAYKYKDGVKTDEVEDFFWKVLTDRRMYDNNGNYLAQKYVTLNDTTEDTVTSFAKKNDGRQYNKTTSLELAEMAKKMKLSGRASENYAEAVELSDVNTKFSLREKDPPKRTLKAYKVFRVVDGKLYPPKIANLTDDESLNVPLQRDLRKGKSKITATGNDTPVGVWIDADVGGLAVDDNGEVVLSSFGRIKVYDLNGASRDKNTGAIVFNEDTTLAFRPGWHLGSIPEAIQFLNGDGTMPDDLVYAECEISADIDYQAAAMSYGVRPSGAFVHADAGLPAVPVDGYYKYKTNPKTDTHPWFISGAIKVVRIVGDAERRKICAQEGVTIAPRYSGTDIEPTDIWEGGQPTTPKDLSAYKKGQKHYENEELLANTLEKIKKLSDENPKLGYVQRDLDFNSKGIVDEIEKAKLDVDALRRAYEKHGYNPYYFDTDEEVGTSSKKDEVKYSDRVLMGSLFSGGGTLEAGLVYQMLDKEFAVEYNEKIASTYTDNHGKEHMFVGDVRDFNSKEKQNVFYLHASPVCKNFSPASHKGGETTLDITTAKATARVLEEQMPQVFTVENVKRYIGSEAYNIIADKLNELGYTWDVDVYKASDYGNATKRERMIIRAVKSGQLPAKPQKASHITSWGEATRDLWETDLIPSNLVKSKIDAIKNTPALKGVRLTKLDKPLLIYDTTKSKTITFAWADELAPTLTTKCGDARIIMPNGRVYAPTPKFMGRIQGLPNDYKYPKATTRAFTIIGNGIPTQLTKAVMGGVLDSAYEKTHDGKVLYSDRKKSSAPTFYSHMGKVVDGIKSEKVGANGVVPYLKGKGVKDEEIKWSGIEAFLEGKKSLTKKELQEFVAGSMDITDSMKDSVLYEGQPLYSERSKTNTSNRGILVNALEGAAQNDIEKNALAKYKAKVDEINAEEAHLKNLRKQIHDLSFTKVEEGKKKDTAKIRELQDEATMSANRIHTFDRQLLSLEATAPIKNLLQREKELVRKRTEQKGREALKEYREKSWERQETALEKQREKFLRAKERASERREMGELRAKIKNLKGRLESALLHPTDRQYIPAQLAQAMIDVCDLVNTDTDLYKKDGSINKAQARRDLTKERLIALKEEYEKLKNNPDHLYSGEYDDVIYEYLTDLRENYKDKPLSSMTYEELAKLYDILHSVNETLKCTRELIGWGSAQGVYEAGDSIVEEQTRIHKRRKNGKRNALQRETDWRLNLSLSPMRAVERMTDYNENSALLKLFKKLEEGVRTKNKFVMESYKAFEHLTSGKNFSVYEDAVYKEFGKKYTDDDGRTFSVSKMQMMQAILSYEREVANKKKHISGSGFTFADLDMLKKGKLRESAKGENAHRVYPTTALAMVNDFKAELADDKWAQEYMAEARKFFDTKSKDAINETYLVLKHRILASEKNYIPFEVDEESLNREISGQYDVQQTINSYGMLQSTKPGASKPLIMMGLNNVIERHIEQVGNVYGLAIPIRNFNKVWNVQSLTDDGKSKTVKSAVGTSWDIGGQNLIEQAIKDLQSKRISTQSAFYKKAKSNYIGSTFLLNGSVVSKQIGSLFASTSMLGFRDPVRLVTNLAYTMANYKRLSAEVDKYTASVWMRRQGLSDQELYTLATQGKESFFGKVFRKLPTPINPTKWISGMDSAVALSLWKYAKQDTAKRTGLKGEELLKATAEYFDSIVENTQSMSDVLHKPEIQKRENIVAESFGMFKTDLYQMSGQLQTALGRYTHNRTKDNGAALAKSAYAVTASSMWGLLMTSTFAALRYKVDQYRDDEDDEVTALSWLSRVGWQALAEFAGYILPLFGSEVVGMIEGFASGQTEDLIDNIAISAANDFVSTFFSTALKLKDGEDLTQKDYEKLLSKALPMFGIPASNVIRTVNAIKLHAKDIANGEFLSFEAGLDTTNSTRLYRAYKSGDKDKIKQAERNYKDSKAIESALREGLFENDNRIREAVMAHYNGDREKRVSLTREIAGEGHFTQNLVIGTVNNAITSLSTNLKNAVTAKKLGNTEEYDKTVKNLLKKYPKDFIEKMLGSTIPNEIVESVEKDLSLYRVGDYYYAALSGDKSLAENAMENVIATDMANGMSREDAEKEFYKDFRDVVRDDYELGALSDEEAIEMLYRHGGSTEKDATSKVQYWAYMMDNPDANVSNAWFNTYNNEVADSGISVDMYIDYRVRTKGIEGDRKVRVMDVIHSLPITIAQKDALYFAEGWTASRLYEAPWH